MELQLENGEYVVYQYEEGAVYFRESAVDFYLTNFNILLVKENAHLFKKSTYDYFRFWLCDIRTNNGIPQISVDKDSNDNWYISVLFVNGIKKFVFEAEGGWKSKKWKAKIESVADKISQLVTTGTIVLRSDTPASSTPSLGDKIAGGLKFVRTKVEGALSSSPIHIPLGGKKKSEPETHTPRVEPLTPTVAAEKYDIPDRPDEEDSVIEEEHLGCKFCHSCGTKMEADARFCPVCGTVQVD